MFIKGAKIKNCCKLQWRQYLLFKEIQEYSYMHLYSAL